MLHRNRVREAVPNIDVKGYANDLETVVGKDALALLDELSEGERESMRFAAERLHGKSLGLAREAEHLLAILRKGQLAARLELASGALKKAENAGDEKEASRLMAECKLLTGQIAKLHIAV